MPSEASPSGPGWGEPLTRAASHGDQLALGDLGQGGGQCCP